jgi:hypothetical protein
MFMSKDGKLVRTISELGVDIGPDSGFVKNNEPIWTNMAKFMGYDGPLFTLDFPFYVDAKIPEGLTLSDLEMENFLHRHGKEIVSDYVPNFNFFQAKQGEQKLMKDGGYGLASVDYQGPEHVVIKYGGSTHHSSIEGKGRNELEAICDACIQFNEGKVSE